LQGRQKVLKLVLYGGQGDRQTGNHISRLENCWCKLFRIDLIYVFKFPFTKQLYYIIHHITRGVRARLVKVVDFKPLALHCCGFESRQELWILSGEENIQLDYETSVPVRDWNNARKGTWGLSPQVKLERRHMTCTVSPKQNNNNNKIKNMRYVYFCWLRNFVIIVPLCLIKEFNLKMYIKICNYLRFLIKLL
jgi:hypothetical protein